MNYWIDIFWLKLLEFWKFIAGFKFQLFKKSKILLNKKWISKANFSTKTKRSKISEMCLIKISLKELNMKFIKALSLLINSPMMMNLKIRKKTIMIKFRVRIKISKHQSSQDYLERSQIKVKKKKKIRIKAKDHKKIWC